jgi:hypothetical protein
VAGVYDEANASGGDAVAALAGFVSADIRRFRDLERPLRLLARREAKTDIKSGLAVADVLIARHPGRARAHMQKAEILEAAGRPQDALAEWRLAMKAIPGDASLYPDLARRLGAYAAERIAGLER